MDGMLANQTQPSAAALQDEVVAIAGRLASLSRAKAQELIAQFGGRFAPRVTRETTLLVVGMQGWPLRADGRVSGKLRKAKRLRESGQPIEIVRESDFLERIGLAQVGDMVCRRYSLDQVARVASVSVERIKTWLKAGILSPAEESHGIPQFEFRQVTAVKRLHELTLAGVTPARLRQSLKQLETWLPDARDWPAQLELLREGGRLVARTDDGALVQADGQRLFDFIEPSDATSGAATTSIRYEQPAPDGDDLFQRALALERQGKFEEAAAGYRELLLAFGPDAQVCFNLGNVLYALARHEGAAERFRQAIEIDPDYVEAWSNLGCALAELDETEEAIQALRRALELRSDYADAIYNLADILQRAGRTHEAQRHWRSYLEHDQVGPWADYAREQLQ